VRLNSRLVLQNLRLVSAERQKRSCTTGSPPYGFKASRLQGFKASRLQGFKASRLQGFKASRLQGFKASVLRAGYPAAT
jgi:hypothetical protein